MDIDGQIGPVIIAVPGIVETTAYIGLFKSNFRDDAVK